MDDMYRVCVKLYADESRAVHDDAFVPIFHRWIRERALGIVLIDVADYAHVPDGPGIVLVAHDVSFALDRSDGRFGLLAQRRRPIDSGVDGAIVTTLRQTFDIALRLEREPALAGALRFDMTRARVEANDRLRAPNGDTAFDLFAARVSAAGRALRPTDGVRVTRVANDPRDRLAVDLVFVESEGAATRLSA